jgi:DNA-binding response OmpR family regulator
VSAVARPYDNPIQDRPGAAPAAAAPAQGAQPKVLIIDDSEATATALAGLLTHSNYAAAVAHRGSDGISLALAEQSVEGGGFAAAVVDIHLPDLHGLVVSQKLREILGPNTPIIVLSGDTSMTTLNSLPHVGATYFFSKPLNAPLFLARLKEWLNPAGGP